MLSSPRSVVAGACAERLVRRSGQCRSHSSHDHVASLPRSRRAACSSTSSRAPRPHAVAVDQRAAAARHRPPSAAELRLVGDGRAALGRIPAAGARSLAPDFSNQSDGWRPAGAAKSSQSRHSPALSSLCGVRSSAGNSRSFAAAGCLVPARQQQWPTRRHGAHLRPGAQASARPRVVFHARAYRRLKLSARGMATHVLPLGFQVASWPSSRRLLFVLNRQPREHCVRVPGHVLRAAPPLPEVARGVTRLFCAAPVQHLRSAAAQRAPPTCWRSTHGCLTIVEIKSPRRLLAIKWIDYRVIAISFSGRCRRRAGLASRAFPRRGGADRRPPLDAAVMRDAPTARGPRGARPSLRSPSAPRAAFRRRRPTLADGC